MRQLLIESIFLFLVVPVDVLLVLIFVQYSGVPVHLLIELFWFETRRGVDLGEGPIFRDSQ